MTGFNMHDKSERPWRNSKTGVVAAIAARRGHLPPERLPEGCRGRLSPTRLSRGQRSLKMVVAVMRPLGICVGVFLASANPSWAESYTGLVVKVADGDTITVLDADKREHKVRLVGIDAPEKSQAFGNVSKQNLAQLVFKKTVTIEVDKLDRYQRDVGKVMVAGADANLEQIKSGLAWHYKQYQREQTPSDRQAYSEAEEAASTAHRGLWMDANPVPPWDFRKAKGGMN